MKLRELRTLLMTSARSVAGAGIVLPTVDHPFRLRGAFRRDRACLALAASRGRPLHGALGSLLGHGISPLLNRRPNILGEANSLGWRPRDYRRFSGPTE